MSSRLAYFSRKVAYTCLTNLEENLIEVGKKRGCFLVIVVAILLSFPGDLLHTIFII